MNTSLLTLRETGLFGLLLLGVLVLPYFVPASSPIFSASSLAGFNNSVAYASYVMVSSALAYLLSQRMSGAWPRAGLDPSRRLFGTPPVAVMFLIACHIALFTALYLQRNGFVFAESLYFQDAAYRVHTGAVPFVDFNFFYGPLLLYPAVFLSAYLGIPGGYGVYYVAAYVAGLYLLYVVIAALVDDRKEAIAWFGLFALGFFNPITGLNYTFGRFMLPAVTLLAVWRLMHRHTVRGWIEAMLLMLVAILCSPDIGAVTLLSVGALIAFAVWQRRSNHGRVRVGSLFGLVATAVLVAGGVLLMIGGTTRPLQMYLKPIVTFSGGGWSTQIDPSLPVLVLLGLTVFFLAQICCAWRRSENRIAVPLIGAFGVMALLMQRASFGKADVVHIAYSGLPIYVAAAAWTGGSRGRQWGGTLAVAATLVLGIVVPLQFYHAMLFVPSIAGMAAVPAPKASAASPTSIPSTKAEVQASIARAVEHFGRDRLYYMHRLEYYRLPIYLQYGLSPLLRHPSLTSAFTEGDIEEVIGELRDSDAIVLARQADLVVVGVSRPLETRWWHYITSSPLPGSTVYNLTVEFQARLEAPLVRFLGSAYDRRFEDGEIVGLELRDPRHTASNAVQ